MAKWYLNYGNGSSTGHYSVGQWTALATYSVGALIRQLAAPAVGSERVFVCVIAGTTLASEPSWTITQGDKTAEAAGPTWQEVTGKPAMNGDSTNTLTWTATRAISTSVAIGLIIKNDAATHYFICDTAGTVGASEPSFDTTAGNTTADNTATWRCLGTIGSFSTIWAAPAARLALFLTATTGWAAAGDDVYASNNSAETQASSMTLTSRGTAASPVLVICVNDSAAPPTTLATTATVTTTGASSISFVGFAYCYGLTFVCGTSSSPSISFTSVVDWLWILDTCALKFGVGTGPSSRITVGGADIAPSSILILKNTTIQFEHASQAVAPNHRLFWINTPATAITGATLPTTLFAAASRSAEINIEGVNLSALGSGKSLFNMTDAQPRITMVNCQLGDSVAFTTGSIPAQGGAMIKVVNCDSGDPGTTGGIDYYQDYAGSWKTESTIIRSSGSKTTVPVSYKFISTANSKHYAPLYGPWISFYNEKLGNINLYLETLTSNVTLTNANAWIEVLYMGTSGNPLGSIASSQISDSIFGTSSSYPISNSIWNGGLATPIAQKIATSINTQEKGVIQVRFVLAIPSTTVYCNMRIGGLPTGRTYMVGNFVNEYPQLPKGMSGGLIR